MQFFKAEGLIQNEEAARPDMAPDRHSRRRTIFKLLQHIDRFNEKIEGKGFFTISSIEEGVITIISVVMQPGYFDHMLPSFIACTKYDVTNIKTEEITFSCWNDYLRHASRESYVESTDEILEKFSLGSISERWGSDLNYGENIIKDKTKDEIEELCKKNLSTETVISEINRIYRSPNHNIQGHPVHYILKTDNPDTRREICRDAILPALYSNGRIQNRRYAFIDFGPNADFSREVFNSLCHSLAGGAILIRFQPAGDMEDGEYAGTDTNVIESIAKTISCYKNDVLTILCLPRECTKMKEMFFEFMGNVSFVELEEDLVEGDAAKSYFKYLAKDCKIRTDKKLFSKLTEGEKYLSTDLKEIFDEWFNEKLKQSVYPEYANVLTVKNEIQKSTPKGSAYEELQGMIGLTSAKKVIGDALDYFKAQKLFAEKGMAQDKPSMHMLFTGNPGSAKTTVARLVAKILKDNGILSCGQIVEVGRADLVGKYVGHTAPLIKKRFAEASGGVLFVDEAYALCDDRDGSFGDEAINTIVAEMENNRSSVLVIFAGYPDKMQAFLNKNPGLKSRIAYHVKFDDYNASELTEIAKLMAAKKGLKIEEDAESKLKGVFELACKEHDFGNGRYARNVMEKARMAQASRLIKMDFDSVTKEDIVTIKAEDIELPEMKIIKSCRQIGFCA